MKIYNSEIMVGLRLVGRTLDVDMITMALGVQPTETSLPRDAGGRHAWIFESSVASDQELAAVIVRLVEIVGGRYSEWRETGIWAVIDIVVSLCDMSEDIMIDHEVLESLSGSGLPIKISIYDVSE